MYINNERKFIFICCAKSASTSVLNTVRTEFKPDPPPHIRHMSIETVLSEHPDKRDYFKFAFVRNPWDRIVSCYHDFTQDTSHWSWSKGLLDYKNFEDFCIKFPDSEWSKWVHFLPLSNRLSIDGILEMDFIGKYENLQSDFEKLCNKLNMEPKELPLYRKSNREKNYRKYFTKDTKKIIEEFYKEDINNFNYDF